MCLIAVRTKQNKLSEGTIRTIFNGNPDGAGIMWAENGLVHWQKGFFNVDKLIEAWNKIPLEKNAVLHCRIKTHGAVGTELCHPFPLTDNDSLYAESGTAKCCLAHNGVMYFMEKSEFYDKEKDSDSSAYAKKVFSKIGSKLPTGKRLKAIRNDIGDSRMVFLDGNDNLQFVGEWEFKDGIFYSNSNWKERYTYNWYNPSKNYMYDNDWYDTGYTKNYTTGLSIINKESKKGFEIADEFGLTDCKDYGIVMDTNGNEITDKELYTDGYDVFEIVNGEPIFSTEYLLMPYDDLDYPKNDCVVL